MHPEGRGSSSPLDRTPEVIRVVPFHVLFALELMADLLSLAQVGLPVKVVVLNNGTLGFVELERHTTGFLDFGTPFRNPNSASMAEAVGIRGIRLENLPT
jgi:thiamine pyrophosphate-dependent acetolactate synthase large subunit-like protein